MSCKKTADRYARSLADPAAAHAAWREHGVAVLPLGVRFEAVRIPDGLVHGAVESSEDRVVDLPLALALEGPVIHDARGRNHYALVAPGTALRWRSRGAVECLGDGTHLGVPDPVRDRAAPGRCLYRAVAPGAGAHFCHVAAVRLLVRVGEARLTGPGTAT
ncbi:hypothetical protein [Streptomyces sp. 3211]|uniref:hypothetical protein n=1 Tax=Streptomyces sp. 3211 TaxID=1964449 RepID=UPI0009A527CE|nr:hypothetical protein [Streptomyces sp. 3211]